MKSSLFRELTLYRYRYVLGYGLFVLLLGYLLLVGIHGVPYGVSEPEMNSAIASNSLNPLKTKALDVVNLPYHLLQKASIGLFGLSPLTMRLPSLVLAMTAGLVLALMLNQWFRKNVALLSLLIVMSSVPFIAMGRTGTAAVLYLLLLLVIMLGAVKLTTRAPGTFGWKLLVATAGLLLLYTPLGIYALLALLIAGALHPHVRYQIKRTKWWQVLVLCLLALVLTAPIIIASMADSHTLRVLLGVEAIGQSLQLTQLRASLGALVKNVLFISSPHTALVAPFLSLTFLLFVLFGFVKAIKDRHAARSYLLFIWLAISLPLLIINPSHITLFFVPCIIMLAIGLETFVSEWYKLFPRNPYARISALIPLAIIIVGLIATSMSRYFYGYIYSDTTATYHPELSAVRQVLKPHIQTRLVVPAEHVSFYDILRRKNPLLSVSSTRDIKPASQTIVLDRAGVLTGQTPIQIKTSYLSENGVLLRVYGVK